MITSVSIDRSRIRVKAMIIVLDRTGTHHLVSVNHPTAENRLGYHRLVGGTVEFGETTRHAIAREIREELNAEIHGLDQLGVLENIFRFNGEAAHELVIVFTGRLEPEPPKAGGVLTESNGAHVPIVWRPVDDADQPMPLHPAGAADWARRAASWAS